MAFLEKIRAFIYLRCARHLYLKMQLQKLLINCWNMQTIPFDDLAFLWTSCRMTDPDSCKGVVHHGPTECALQFVQKLVDTGKAASKLYVVFHLIPFTMRLRKIKTAQQFVTLFAKTVKDYGRSLCFMSFLVGLLRGLLCVNWNMGTKSVIRPWIAFTTYMSPLSAISILFEDKSRRSEVVYHVCAKALRSTYMITKRVWGWQWGDESMVMHVLVMGMLYYVYNDRPQTLKFRSIFELILGDS